MANLQVPLQSPLFKGQLLESPAWVLFFNQLITSGGSSVPKHANSHEYAGSDSIPLDTLDIPTDITTLNANTSSHGLMPKLDNNANHFINGQGAFITPPTLPHASTHQSNGSDAIAIDTLASPTDNTNLNVSSGAHGLCAKLTMDLTQFFRGDGNWATPLSSVFDPEVSSVFYDDFLGATTSGGNLYSDKVWDTVSVTITAVAGTNGVIRITSDGSSAPAISPAGGITQLAWVQSKNPTISIIEAQYGTVTAFTRYMGFGDSILNTAPTNGIYFRHAKSANYIAVCRSSSSESTTDTGVAASNGVFHKLKLVVNGTTSVTPYVDGTSKTAITTNIPTANLCLSFGTNNLALEGLDLDEVYITQTR